MPDNPQIEGETPAPPLVSLDQRAEALTLLAEGAFDVLVIGGGITGVGSALDAVTRGLEVGLIEARDYASGTSSKSSKLIHGGLRYLEQMDFHLVREALHERDLLLNRLAPHLVKPVSFLYPLTRHGWERAYVGAGLALYDALGGARSLPRHRHLTRRGARAIAPYMDGLARLQITMNRVDEAPGQPTNYMVGAVTATPGYFSTLGMRLQTGRFFTDADDPDHQQVMIMTASTARQNDSAY